MTGALENKSLYLAQFASVEKELSVGRGSWIGRLRQSAIARFSELGFPTTREEEWKYTSVEPIARTPFRLAEPGTDGVRAAHLAPYAFGDLACTQLVFVNGHYAPQLSALRPLPRGVRAAGLAAALQSSPELVEPFLARYAAYDEYPFAALNTAFLRDGAFISIPPGVVLEEPIHVLYVSAGGTEPTVSHPRTLIVAGENSQASVVESYGSAGSGACFTNAVTEIVAGAHAVVEHVRLERESPQAFHLATVRVHMERDSHLTTHAITLGGGLVRNELNAVLAAEGVECVLNGLYLTSGRQHVDNHTRIEHAMPHGSSRELYKGVLADQSRGVFNGRIVVRKGAQKTDAKQTNKNLLLSEDALVDTNPQLEIFADDVKCTHGATIGQLDEDALFYLRTRGIDANAARSLLIYAFAGDIVNRIRIEPVRAALDRVLLEWLPGSRPAEGLP